MIIWTMNSKRRSMTLWKPLILDATCLRIYIERWGSLEVPNTPRISCTNSIRDKKPRNMVTISHRLHNNNSNSLQVDLMAWQVCCRGSKMQAISRSTMIQIGWWLMVRWDKTLPSKDICLSSNHGMYLKTYHIGPKMMVSCNNRLLSILKTQTMHKAWSFKVSPQMEFSPWTEVIKRMVE